MELSLFTNNLLDGLYFSRQEFVILFTSLNYRQLETTSKSSQLYNKLGVFFLLSSGGYDYSRGLALFTFILRPIQLAPSNVSIAFSSSASLDISTKANPLRRPVSRSVGK